MLGNNSMGEEHRGHLITRREIICKISDNEQSGRKMAEKGRSSWVFFCYLFLHLASVKSYEMVKSQMLQRNQIFIKI